MPSAKLRRSPDSTFVSIASSLSSLLRMRNPRMNPSPDPKKDPRVESASPQGIEPQPNFGSGLADHRRLIADGFHRIVQRVPLHRVTPRLGDEVQQLRRAQELGG